MRTIYTLVLGLFSPIILAYVWFKIHRPNQVGRFSERLGFIKKNPADLWLHAASVGEVKIAADFTKQLIATKPDLKIIISTMTYTGYQSMQHQLGKDFPHFFLCLDLPFIWRQVLKTLKPSMLIILERELWPNLIYQSQKFGIKTALINAKFSEQSWFKGAYQAFDLICAQSPDDCQKFKQSGVIKNKCKVTGNLKFDLQIDSNTYNAAQKIKQEIGARPIWIAGSTHTGEDEVILNIHREILKTQPDTLLILAPRHPERFDEVYTLIQNHSVFSCLKYSQAQNILPTYNVLLLDTLGKLLLYYGVADVALVAGSLFPHLSGHNLLEPAAFSKPVVCGKYLADFKQIEKMLLKAKGLTQIESTKDGADKINRLLSDQSSRDKMGANAKSVVDANQGAREKTLRLISAQLD